MYKVRHILALAGAGVAAGAMIGLGPAQAAPSAGRPAAGGGSLSQASQAGGDGSTSRVSQAGGGGSTSRVSQAGGGGSTSRVSQAGGGGSTSRASHSGDYLIGYYDSKW